MSNWLSEAVFTRTSSVKIPIRYDPILLQKIWPRKKPTPVTELLKRAEKYAEMLSQGKAKSQAEIARRESVNRARITQITNLLKLSPEIQDYLKNLKEPRLIHYFTEKRLRPIAKIKDHQEQIRKFQNPQNEVLFKDSSVC